MIYITGAATRSYLEANAQPMVAWDNLFARGAIVNPDLPIDAPRSNAAEENTADFWRSNGANTYRATFATAQVADIAFFNAHSLAGVAIDLQTYNGSTWTTFATITPPDNQPFMVVWPRKSALGWGFSVDAESIVGNAWIGPRVIIPGGVEPGYVPIWASRVVNKWGGGTRRGHWLGQRCDSVTAELSASFMPISHDFSLNGLRAFRDRYNSGRAFIWASAPGIFKEDAAYCWAANGASLAAPIMAGGDLVGLSLQMSAYCEP